MFIVQAKPNYGDLASQFLKRYYEEQEESTLVFAYRLLYQLVSEAVQIAKSEGLSGMHEENALISVWFRYAGLRKIDCGYTVEMKELLQEYFAYSNYPEGDRLIVLNTIESIAGFKMADTKISEVASDAIYSQLASREILENIILIKDLLNRINEEELPELFYLRYYLSLFIKRRYYTAVAKEVYSKQHELNFHLIEERIRKIGEGEKKKEKAKSKAPDTVVLSNKETEDLFKMAFRNYNRLISVADSKASLLIRINSVIITIIIAFVLGKYGHSLTLIWPAVILLAVSMMTILMSILASRPQSNIFLEDRKSHTYQRFFFGSFDMVDSTFLHVKWEDYLKQLNSLFSDTKEVVYMEVYKESFNVRKVLSKKFNYLSIAYWVFLSGIVISVLAFGIVLYKKN